MKKAAPFLGLLAALAVFFLPVLDSPQLMPFSFFDFSSLGAFPYHTRQLILEGGFPYWTTAEWAGQPWIHSMTGVYYPFNWPFFLGAPWPQYFLIDYLIHLSLAAMGVYLFTRDLGAGRSCALAAGLAFALGRNVMMRIVGGLPCVLQSLTWIPWFFWAIERGLRHRRLVWFALAGLFNALPVLTGFAEYAIFLGNAFLPYVLIRSWMRSGAGTRREAFWFAAKGLAVYGVSAALMALPQSMPAWQLLNESTRVIADVDYDSKASALHPLYLFLYLFPDVFGSPFDGTFWGPVSSIWGAFPYLGVATVFGALWAAARGVGPAMAVARFFGGFALVYLLLAMGGYTPVFPALREILPLFSSFRMTYKIIPVAEFFICVLAALGWQEMMRQRAAAEPLVAGRTARRMLWACAVLCLAAPAVVWAFRDPIYEQVRPIGVRIIDYYYARARGPANPIEYYYGHIPRVYSAILRAVTTACVSILIMLAFFRWVFSVARFGRVGVILLPVLVFLDVWVANGKFIFPGHLEHYFPTSRIYKYINDTIGIERLNGYAGAWAIDTSLKYGWQDVNGGMGVKERIYMNYLEVIEGASFRKELIGQIEGIRHIDHPLYNLLGVRYLLTEAPVDTPGHRLVMSDTDHPVYRSVNYMDLIFDKKSTVYLYENEKRLPRIFVAQKTVVAPGEAGLEALKRLGEDVKSVAVLDRPASRTDWEADTPTARPVSYKSSRIEIAAETRTGGVLVLTDRYRSGWRASVNGVEQPVLRADYLFRGVEIGPGASQVVFWYDPREVKLGWVFGIFGLGWLAFWFLRTRWT